jgi:hypothetical protein
VKSARARWARVSAGNPALPDSWRRIGVTANGEILSLIYGI